MSRPGLFQTIPDMGSLGLYEPELTARPTTNSRRRAAQFHREEMAKADHRSDSLYTLGLAVLKQAMSDLRDPSPNVVASAYGWLMFGPEDCDVIEDKMMVFVPLANFLGLSVQRIRAHVPKVLRGY